jgi:hypothetical protein
MYPLAGQVEFRAIFLLQENGIIPRRLLDGYVRY